MSSKITSFENITELPLKALRGLVRACIDEDGVAPKVYWHNMQERECVRDFFYYEGERLKAYLGYFEFAENEYEVTAMVHPDVRKKGVFRALFHEAKAKGMEAQRLLFPCPRGVDASEQCLQSMGAVKDKSEFLMDRIIGEEETVSDIVSLQRATVEDAALLVSIDSVSFNHIENDLQQYYEHALTEKWRKVWLIRADEKTVGKIHMRIENGLAFFHDIAVRPEFRGRSFATMALKKAINTLLNEGYSQMRLEVYTNNENALKVYERCHFERLAVYDYWVLH